MVPNDREPIPLPERFRPLRSVKRIERVRSNAGAVLRPRVIWSKSLVMVGKSLFA